MPVECHSSDYFRGREAKERELADRASAEDVRKIYLSLAAWYRLLADNAEQDERKSGIRNSRKNRLSHRRDLSR